MSYSWRTVKTFSEKLALIKEELAPILFSPEEFHLAISELDPEDRESIELLFEAMVDLLEIAESVNLKERIRQEKRRARAAVGTSVKRGELERPLLCEWTGCSQKPVEAHHEDYANPLAVRWLCKEHHARVHRKFGY